MLTGCLTTAPVRETAAAAAGSENPEGFILDKRVVYEYSNEGLKIKKYDYDKNNQVKETVEYIYENSVLTGKKFFDENNNYDSYENYQYDTDGRLIRETEYRPDGSVKNYKEYEYSENGSYLKKYFDDDGSLYRVILKKYNSEGNVTEESDSISETRYYK